MDPAAVARQTHGTRIRRITRAAGLRKIHYAVVVTAVLLLGAAFALFALESFLVRRVPGAFARLAVLPLRLEDGRFPLGVSQPAPRVSLEETGYRDAPRRDRKVPLPLPADLDVPIRDHLRLVGVKGRAHVVVTHIDPGPLAEHAPEPVLLRLDLGVDADRTVHVGARRSLAPHWNLLGPLAPLLLVRSWSSLAVVAPLCVAVVGVAALVTRGRRVRARLAATWAVEALERQLGPRLDDGPFAVSSSGEDVAERDAF